MAYSAAIFAAHGTSAGLAHPTDRALVTLMSCSPVVGWV